MKVEAFHSAQLFKDTEIVEAVQEGLVELALVPVNKWSEWFQWQIFLSYPSLLKILVPKSL